MDGMDDFSFFLPDELLDDSSEDEGSKPQKRQTAVRAPLRLRSRVDIVGGCDVPRRCAAAKRAPLPPPPCARRAARGAPPCAQLLLTARHVPASAHFTTQRKCPAFSIGWCGTATHNTARAGPA